MTPLPQRPSGRRATAAAAASSAAGVPSSDFPSPRRDPWKDTKFAVISSRYSPVARRMMGHHRSPAILRRSVSTASSENPVRISGAGDCISEVEMSVSAPVSPSTPPASPPPMQTPMANATPLLNLQGRPPDLVGDDLIQGLQRSSGSTSSATSSASSAFVVSGRTGADRPYGSEEEMLPGPSSPEEKRAMFRGCLTRILSCVYAVFIVTLGAVIYTSSLFSGKSPLLAEAFSLYLVLVGLAYFIFLYTDIRRYLSCMQRRHNYIVNLNDRALLKPPMAGDMILPGANTSTTSLSMPHHYCFSSASHAGSFYLKVGAAGFCFGHLVHSSLLLAQQVALLVADPDEFHHCASPATLLLDILHPVYSFVQLFFIFKYSNVIINRGKEVARFAVMHCLATSLCFWLWTILRETVDSLSHHTDEDDLNDYDEHTESSFFYGIASVPPSPTTVSSTYLVSSAPTMLASLFTRAEPVTTLPLIAEPTATLNAELTRVFNTSAECRGVGQLSSVLDSLSPYLYPFTIEYSIVVVGILFIIWQNIGTCSNNQLSSSPNNSGSGAFGAGSRNGSTHGSTASLCRPPPMTPQSGFVSNVVVHADCHSANKGLFAGLIVLVGSAISIILFLLAMADSEYVDVGLTVNAATELALLVIMTVAVSFAYGRLVKLDVIKGSHHHALLDDLLLFLCIPAFFLYAILSVGPSIKTRRYLTLATVLLQVVQVLLQTPFIMDGLRRCSNTQSLRLRKPGRELVTFLIVCNLALWITDTFEIRSQETRDPRTHFYGRVPWTAISHATVPLTMLYRFHSSGCLVHIWKAAYEPEPAKS